MPETRFLNIWSAQGFKVDMDAIKAAKKAMNVDFLVVPRRAGVGVEGRVLAIGSNPPFLCDYALWSGTTGQAGLDAALDWVLGTHDDPRATTVLDILGHFMPGIREMSQEELDSEEKMRQYLNREI